MLDQPRQIELDLYAKLSFCGCDKVLTSIDLFCGAGGLTAGFKLAGFRCLYGNDCNPSAIQTFKHNHPETHADSREIEAIDPRSVRQMLQMERGELTVLTGGPPCQGFSINAPERFLDDRRNALFKHYVRFLDEFFPKAFVFENVPGMLSLAGGRIFGQIANEFTKRGYQLSAKILFAAHYGVPQERWRLFLLGSRDGKAPVPPEPTHYAEGRANFRGGRTMTFRVMQSDAYQSKAVSDYARLMRNGNKETYNHYAAILAPQNRERLKYIRPGGSWRDIPHRLLPAGMKRARRSDHTRRYGRLRADGLAGTIMTKCDPHWGPVFLPDQERSLTVREAARLQSFPDDYRFLGSRVSQYEQVGNAVPVLMARAVAEAIAEHLAT